MQGDDDAKWVKIGNAALGVWAAFNRENWKRRAAFTPPAVGEETPEGGLMQNDGEAPSCLGRGQTPANDNARKIPIRARE